MKVFNLKVKVFNLKVKVFNLKVFNLLNLGSYQKILFAKGLQLSVKVFASRKEFTPSTVPPRTRFGGLSVGIED